ncbi:hypothetical protein TNCT_333401, partial [Trichonephila clavata]
MLNADTLVALELDTRLDNSGHEFADHHHPATAVFGGGGRLSKSITSESYYSS